MVLLAALLAVAAVLVWLLLDRLSESPAPRPAPREEPASAPPPAPPPTPPATPPREASVRAVLPEGAVVFDPPELEHPHPITPEREHIQRENQILGAMNDAMDNGNGARLREILAQYKDEYPEDPNQLQEGYQIIADCMEHPGPAATAAGQRYYDVERGSILRLFVGRHCLGIGNP